MFGRKKEQKSTKPSKGKGQALFQQMGMFDGADMANMESQIYGNLEDDEDLEAELQALQKAGSNGGSPKKMKKDVLSAQDLDKIMQQGPEHDEDIEVSDTEDPDLLSELQELSTNSHGEEEPPDEPPPTSGPNMVSVLEDRQGNYKRAIEVAKASDSASKVKRLDRGLKTINDLLKKAKAGRPVSEEDIPTQVAETTTVKPSPTHQPEVIPSTMKQPDIPAGNYLPTTDTGPPPSVYKPTTEAAPTPASSDTGQDERMGMLIERRDQYKTAAGQALKSGDKMTAAKYMKTGKQFEAVINALKAGNPIDLSQMPPPPPGFTSSTPTIAAPPPQVTVVRDSHQAHSDTESKQQAAPQPEAAAGPGIPAPPKTVMEGLEQRLERYKYEISKSSGGKQRRMGRIAKQYEEAIRTVKKGGELDIEELPPAPPGYPPLPTSGNKAPAPSPKPSPHPSPLPSPAHETKPMAVDVSSHPGSSHSHAGPPHAKRPTVQRQLSAMSRAEQQTIFLQEKHLQFKKAALLAKQKGDMELAKKYLRQAKGFEPMIEASQQGLPVNIKNIPTLPTAASAGRLAFVPTDKEGKPMGDRDETYKTLEQDLIQQIRSTGTNAEHFTKLGDISTANRFEKMCQNTRKDLDALKNAYKHGDPVPRFHYEEKTFSTVKCCTDLGDNDLQITIVRGINYGLPSGYKPTDLDTYIKYEFPYPNDDPQKGDSDTVKGTNEPEYNQSFKVEANRKSRAFLRLLKSKSIKFEIYYKRGFFKGDKLLGTANFKLQSLTDKCEVHDSYDLMDGRKTVGGKLELKIRIRDPYESKQIEESKEKWLIIDQFERSLTQPKSSAAPAAAGSNAQSKLPELPAPNNQYTSMEVLKYERQLLEQQMKKYTGKLTGAETAALQHKCELLTKQADDIRVKIKDGGLTALKAYASEIETSKNQYLQEAKALVAQGNRDKAQILMTKKKLVEREVESIRSKLPK